MELETDSVPVNANKTSGVDWKKNAAGSKLTGLPHVRDFDVAPMRDLSWYQVPVPGPGMPPPQPPANPNGETYIADPEIKKATVKVTNPWPMNMLEISVKLKDGTNNGQIRLWRDPVKMSEHQLEGILAADGSVTMGTAVGNIPPIYPFYIEGISPSYAQDDIQITVRYTIQIPFPQQYPAVSDSKTISVVPFPLTMDIAGNPQASFVSEVVNGQFGYVGMNSGRQAQVGGALDGVRPGALFSGSAYRKGLPATENLVYIQNTDSVTNGQPAGAVDRANGRLNLVMINGVTLPTLDRAAGESPAEYDWKIQYQNTATVQTITGEDTPSVRITNFPNSLAVTHLSVDMKMSFSLFLVWKFGDGTYYTLALRTWQANFQANIDPQNGLLRPAPGIGVTVDPWGRTHSDPPRVIGPIFNNNFAVR